MISKKTPQEIEILREGGKHAGEILRALKASVVPGISTKDIGILGEKLMNEHGVKSAVFGYKPYGAKRPFPAHICLSVNDAVVHGIPDENPVILKDGDIVAIDVTISYKGLITDTATTVAVGNISKEARTLLAVTEEALAIGIKAAQNDKRTGDIGFAIESFVRPRRFGIITELAGHGVGYKVHEEPYVPNYGNPGEGEKLVPGMVIAIEPMLTERSPEIFLDQTDGYTYRTKDGGLSAHFEHTVAITENGPIILTK